ncbi:hypothetical protein QWY20_08795 [Alkalimonas sp. MEB108]|uniref:Uncharacterized protein n=1 Tax=Alkalimonas cellulosilytica TaxID=3058395 RepID=A0ABU7J6J7_9GAMM|nr:hypothetical protein [Alkalimonas sp. MEB108]MEE2001550.1 hypothetical protein [Alkalimonas sp. MEB108]
MKNSIFVIMLLGATPMLVAEQAKLEAMCEIGWTAYHTQNISLIAPLWRDYLPDDWPEERKAETTELFLADRALIFERARQKHGNISYQLAQVRFYDTHEIPKIYSQLNAKRYATLRYEAHSADNPQSRLSASCTFFDYDGDDNWQINTILWNR